MIKKIIIEEWETSDHKRFPIEDRKEALQYETEYQKMCADNAKAAMKATILRDDTDPEYSRGHYLGGHE